MELHEAITRRRMTRRFAATPIDPAVVDGLLSKALQAPSAGSSQGVDFVLLDTAEDRRRFFEMTTDAEWRERTAGSAEGLLAAPVIVVPLADESAYVRRYSASDKAGSSLAGLPAGEWPVPYWLVDASFATMLLLLAATDAGLGALFFRLHRDPGPWLASIGVPERRLALGAVALGHPLTPPADLTPSADLTPAPADRPPAPTKRPRRRPFGERVHRARW